MWVPENLPLLPRQFNAESFGMRLRQERKFKFITQKGLAVQLGVSDSTVSNWEKGLSLPDVHALTTIARYLDVSIDWLACLTDERKLKTRNQNFQPHYTTGPKLYDLRVTNRVSQKQIAAAINSSPSTISSWEHGTPISLEANFKIAAVFHVSLDWLYGITDDMTPYTALTVTIMNKI